jgi:ABC-type Fe3+-hydroxamate transport system substrate-binding protein
MPAVTDALGRRISLDHPPRRIVSLVPSITDALFAFGAGEAVAGVTRFCLEPRDAVAGKAKVGGTKTPDLEAVLGLEPDLVLANVEENRREDIESLIAAGVTVFVTYPRTVEAAVAMMRDIAALTGTEEGARPYIDEADAEVARSPQAAKRDTVRVFCPIWRNPWMTIGPDTYMHDFLRVCGGENIFGDRPERYPQIELDEIPPLRPDVILLPDEPYRFRERHVPELAGLDTPAARNGRIHLLEGKHLSWYGPRIAPSIRHVRAILSAG